MLTPNRELKRKALESLALNWGNSILMLIVLILLSLGAALIPLGTILIGWPLSIGSYNYFFRLAAHKEATLNNLFKPFSFYGNSILFKFLLVLIEVIVALPLIIALVVFFVHNYFSFDLETASIGSSVWLIIIALLDLVLLYYVSIRLYLAYYLLADYPNLAADKVISIAWKAMKDKFWKLFGLLLSFIGWFILAILTFGIGFLWLIPYINTSLAHFYLDVKREENIAQQVYDIMHLEEQPPEIGVY